jgi:hypothetical protein
MDIFDQREIFCDQNCDTQYTYTQYKNDYQHLYESEGFYLVVIMGYGLHISGRHKSVLILKQAGLPDQMSSILFGDVVVHHRDRGYLVMVRLPDMV